MGVHADRISRLAQQAGEIFVIDQIAVEADVEVLPKPGEMLAFE